jgi:hypothetical protein
MRAHVTDGHQGECEMKRRSKAGRGPDPSFGTTADRFLRAN